MTLSIADVACSTVEVETCVATPARFAAGILNDNGRNPFAGWQTSAMTLRMHRLRDVVLDRASMVLLKDGEAIAETIYVQPPEIVAALRVHPDRLVVADLGHAVATCCDHWNANYYHWVAHTLPALHAIRERRLQGDVGLIVPRLAPWQRQSLDLIGASVLPTITTLPGIQYFLPCLDWYDYVAGHADFVVSALSRAAYAHIVATVAVPDDSPRLIYIDRSGAPNRSVPNEAALIERLRQRGFRSVRPETMGATQAIALFKGAGMVIGQLGAGLANIAFCRPGAVVYELVPSHHRNPCFLAMAMQGGLQVPGPTRSPPALRAATTPAPGPRPSTLSRSSAGLRNSRP